MKGAGGPDVNPEKTLGAPSSVLEGGAFDSKELGDELGNPQTDGAFSDICSTRLAWLIMIGDLQRKGNFPSVPPSQARKQYAYANGFAPATTGHDAVQFRTHCNQDDC